MANDKKVLEEIKKAISEKATTLHLARNRLTTLPPEIAQLTNLTKLSLEFNNLTTFPPEIAQLTNLTELNLGNNQLTTLPPEIAQLTNLTELYLWNNQLKTLPPEIEQLTNLTELYLAGNRLKTLPPEIAQLTNLTVLDLEDNLRTTLPPEIAQLTNLRKLKFRNNKLKTFPSEIAQLTSLTELYLHENQLTTFPPEIAQLTNLTELYLGDNHLTTFPPEIVQFTNLAKLDLRNNQLKILPGALLELNMEIVYTDDYEIKGINLSDNPIENPPIEVVKKGKDAIRAYLKSLEGEKEALNEVKVLLVGEGGAGKTSLLKRLTNIKFNKKEAQTPGINIKDWAVEEKGKEIKIHFWDFGGQEIMHATHQFFLSKRSLYILVIDGRKDEKLEYWLKHIESFGGDSPVLVVLNKMDENPGFDVNRLFLQNKYKGIVGFYPISCKTDRGIKTFTKILIRELAKSKLLETMWAKTWFNVKTRLENMSDSFINYDRYTEICAEENLFDTEQQDTLIEFLHDLGVVVNFKDFDLEDTHVLEPNWATSAVYKIINSEQLAESKGVLQFDFMKTILKKQKKEKFDYPKGQHRYIIELMKKFELCFSINDTSVLVPDLLPVPEPEFDFNYKDSLNFFIEYDFLPKTVMPRFIVKMHNDIHHNICWRTGVVLKDKDFDSTAVVKADDVAKKIFIYVNGAQRLEYFAVILFSLREINQSFKKLKAIEKVPMPDNPEISVSYKHLLFLNKSDIQTFIPDGSEEKYNTNDLLGRISVEVKDEDEVLEILRELLKRIPEKKAKKIFTLNPNINGLGIDINALIDKISGEIKQADKK